MTDVNDGMMCSAVFIDPATGNNINRRNFVELDIERVNLEIIRRFLAAKNGFGNLR